MSDKEKIIEIFSKVGADFDTESQDILFINDEIMMYFDKDGNLIKYHTLD